MFTQRLVLVSQRRYASNSFFGNLGDSMAKIVPKPHLYFQVSKPVGVKEQPKLLGELPKKSFFTWERFNFPKRMWDFYFDGVTRRTKVAEIQKEMAYGGMYDFHVYNKTKGRLFQSPPSYFRADKSLYFPNFAVRNLLGKKDEMLRIINQKDVTILRIFSTDSGVEMLDNYFKIPNSEDTYLSKSGISVFNQQYPKAQIVEVMLSENKVKNFVHNYISPSSIKKIRSETQYDKYVTAVRDEVMNRATREAILATNVYSGFVYVLDDKARIRWAGSGLPDEKDIQGLWKAVKGVEREPKLRVGRK